MNQNKKCQGENCQSTDGRNHSVECLFEHFMAYTSGRREATDVQLKLKKAYFDGHEAGVAQRDELLAVAVKLVRVADREYHSDDAAEEFEALVSDAKAAIARHTNATGERIEMFCTPITTVKARKAHRCTWCGEVIAVGEEHAFWKSVDNRKRRQQKLYEGGYDFAAGAVLRGMPVEKLEEYAAIQFDRNEFEDGIVKALVAWSQVKQPCPRCELHAKTVPPSDAMRAELSLMRARLFEMQTAAIDLREKLTAAEGQRDECQLALERALSWLTSYPGGGAMGPTGPYEQARRAIARCTPQPADQPTNAG